MSLVSKYGTYTSDLDASIRAARNAGVTVVVAAGNGQDEGDERVAIDTTKQKVSPVCNDA